MTRDRRLRTAVLGATGAVGQRFVSLLANHPRFEIARLAASDRSAGKPYREACRWFLPTPLSEEVGAMVVEPMGATGGIDVAFSALSADVAGEVELRWARIGVPVFSNARNHRMDPDVPLLIPEVNPDHLQLIAGQQAARGLPPTGYVVTNANCSATVLTMALAPLHRAFGVELVSVVTLQAISGAGYPGLSALDISNNVIPFIAGEEEKLESETQKILGSFESGAVHPADITISAQVNRVPVADGHSESVSLKLARRVSLADVRQVLEDFRSERQIRGLPSAPSRPVIVMDAADRPQPKLDVEREFGMAVFVGRLRPCSVLDFKMTVLGHNTIRGAAGGSILNAELALARGLLGGAS
jgi:aspartate-semialdehyde dehydrogenase